MLEGIRIVDMTSIVFGPYATQMLADLGAEVIKVEPPTGDIARGGPFAKTPGMGVGHMTLNNGKMSVVLDLKKPDDAAKMRALLKTADVFIHNVRAKAIERLGFDYEAVRALRDDIIYAHCVGFGSGGRYRDLPAYDDVIQAATGTATLLPRVDGDERPRYLPSLIGDKVPGLYGAYAVLGALVHKLRTGEGQRVEIPMFEAFTHFMMQEHLFGGVSVPQTAPMGYPRQLDPSRQPFPTADGHITIVLYTDEISKRLIEVFDDAALGRDARFGTPEGRMRHSAEFYGEIARRTPARTTAEWSALFSAAGIPSMPLRDLADLREDPHLQDVGFFKRREHPSEGGYLALKPPVSFSAYQEERKRHAPRLGEHNDQLDDLIAQRPRHAG